MTGGRAGCRRQPLTLSLPPAETVALEVRLLEASHAFEVSDKGSLIVSGERAPGAVASPGQLGDPRRAAPGSALPALRPSCRAPPLPPRPQGRCTSGRTPTPSSSAAKAARPRRHQETQRLRRAWSWRMCTRSCGCAATNTAPSSRASTRPALKVRCTAPHFVLGGESWGETGPSPVPWPGGGKAVVGVGAQG